MINVSNEFKELMQTRTDFKEYAEVTFASGSKITLDESQFTMTNNSITDGAALSAVPIGVAIQKIVQLEILNDQEQWESYDFYGARIHLYLTFELSSTTEKVERGYYTVTTPETHGDTIIITAYDDMYKTDTSYSTSLTFPATIKNMLIDVCQTCGIPLLSTTFANDDFTVPTMPDSQYTFRQVISYIAMLACGNARINNAGYLEILTYANITGNQYYSSLDGIETGAPERVLKSWQSLTADKNDITITGVALSITTTEGQEKRLTGEEGYVITVTNPLINVEDETALATAMYNISEHLIGLTFRKFDGTSVANPLIEFMDFVAVKDRRGRLYKSFVTDITFAFLGSTTVKNSAGSAVQSNAVYAGDISTEVRLRKLVEAEKTARELAVETLSTALANSSGLYETEETQPDGSTIYYFHDKPTLAESAKIIKLTADAIGVSSDGGKTYPYGFTVTGEMVTRLLAAEGINADWIKTGALTVKDSSGNTVFSADMDSSTVTMNSALVSVDGKSLTSKFSETKTYTDSQVADAKGYTDTQVSNANSYTDNQIAASEKTAAKTYATQSSVTQTASEIRTEVSAVQDSANSYTDTQISGAKTYTDNQIAASEQTAANTYATKSSLTQTADSITSTVSSVNSTATEALNKANSAKEYTDAVSSQFGYPYSTELIIYGARTDYYYPVYFGFGNQSIPRDILVYRWYGQQAPSDWNPSESGHMGALTFRIKANFGGWGGIDYQCEILDFSEEYSTMVGDVKVAAMDGYGLCIWLRGGGTTGAKYQVCSDQPLEYTSDSNDWHASLPYIGVTTDTQFGWNGGTESSPKHSWTAAAPLTTPNTTHLNSLWALKTATTASSRIEQLKDSITLSVTGGSLGNTAKIKLGIDGETREAGIDLTGAVTFSDLSTAGSTTINGSNITTGTISADRIDTSALFAKDITATGKFQFDNGRYSLTINEAESNKGITIDSWGKLQLDATTVLIYGGLGYITLSTSGYITLQSPTCGTIVDGPLSVTGDLTVGDKKLESGSWTPTVSGMGSYSYRYGKYFKFGNIVIVSFCFWGIMAGSISAKYKISGCPYTPIEQGSAGGGNLSGYYVSDDIVFTGWDLNSDGGIYACGQIAGTGNKWGAKCYLPENGRRKRWRWYHYVYNE